MTYDLDYPQRERQALYRRRRLSVLLAACVVLALLGLATTGPSDVHIEGGQRTEAVSQ